MKINVQSGMYYFLTEDEAFKVLLNMGYLCKQKEENEEELLYFFEERRVFNKRNGRHLPIKIGGTYLPKWGGPT